MEHRWTPLVKRVMHKVHEQDVYLEDPNNTVPTNCLEEPNNSVPTSDLEEPNNSDFTPSRSFIWVNEDGMLNVRLCCFGNHRLTKCQMYAAIGFIFTLFIVLPLIVALSTADERNT